LGLEGFDGILFYSVGLSEGLVIVKVDEVGCSIVLASLVALWAVSSEVSYFSTLKASIQ